MAKWTDLIELQDIITRPYATPKNKGGFNLQLIAALWYGKLFAGLMNGERWQGRASRLAVRFCCHLPAAHWAEAAQGRVLHGIGVG